MPTILSIKIKPFPKGLLVWIFILSLLWSAFAFKGTFNDEHDNWLGGQLIIAGKVPYRDFFSHHAPLTYYMSAFWQLIGFSSPVWIRLGVMTFWLLSFSISYRCVGKSMRKYVALSYLMSALFAPMVSAQMFLAESFVAIAFMPLFWCGYARSKDQKRSSLMFISLGVLSFIIVFSAPVYVFSLALILTYIFSVSGFERGKKWLLWLALFYLVLPIMMLFQGAIKDFYYAYFEFNSQVYYPLRLMQHSETAFMSLLVDPWINLFSLTELFFSSSLHYLLTIFTTLKQFAFGLGVNEAKLWLQVAIASYVQVIWNIKLMMWLSVITGSFFLLFKRLYVLTVFYVLILLYLGVRTTELFHLSPMFFGGISFLCICMHELRHQTKYRYKAIMYSFILTFFLLSTPRYINVASQATAYYYPSTQKALLTLKEASLHKSTLQNLSPDVGLFHALPTLNSASSVYYYYPWIHAAMPLRQVVLQAMQSDATMVIYAPNKLDYAPEINRIIHEQYNAVGDGVFIKKNAPDLIH